MAGKDLRLLDEILNNIEQKYKFDLPGQWTSNSYWKDALSHITDFDSFAKSIINVIESCTKVCMKNDLCKYHDKLKDDDFKDRRTHITLTRNGSIFFIDSNETFVERLLSYWGNNCQNGGKYCSKYWNQFQIGKSYKEAVDIRINESNKIKYVELKVLNDAGKADNPFVAIIENIKNYYLSMEKDNISELIILAPNDYWEAYYKDEKEKHALDNLKNALCKQSLNIRFATNGCTRKRLSLFLEEIKKHIHDEDFFPKVSKSRKPKHTHAASYDVSLIYDWLSRFKCLEELLMIKYID